MSIIIKEQFLKDGFAIIDDVFAKDEINNINKFIEEAETFKPTFRKTTDLFAIRQFLKEIPAIYNLIFTAKFKSIILRNFSTDYFVVKSIYFDKPERSNWLVPYHQDLTISVNKKIDEKGYTNWTVKQNQFAVQPPVEILKSNFTVRIHLDKTDASNGALKIIAGSHLKGIYKIEMIDRNFETICNVNAGGIMFMSPLLLHASDKTLGNNRRRVIHIEFSNCSLPEGLEWSEKSSINYVA